MIGPGTFTAPTVSGYVTGFNPVQVVGSGAGVTTLTGPAGTDLVLYLGNHDSLVSDLSVEMPADNSNFTKVGIHLGHGSARRVSVSADPTITPVAIGVQMGDGTLEDSTVALDGKVPGAPVLGATQPGASGRGSDAEGAELGRRRGPVHFAFVAFRSGSATSGRGRISMFVRMDMRAYM